MTAATSRAREPIAGANPAGDDLTYDAAFESVSKEITKLESVAGGIPNWKDIEASGDRLLAERTKDHRLVVWSAAAKSNLRGWEGLADGLSQYLDVLVFWDAMYPPVRRLRARANLHEWFIQHVVTLLEDRAVQRKDEGALVAAQATLQEVESTLDDKLGELHPGSARLRSLLQRKLMDMPADEAPPPPPAAAPVEAAPASIRDPRPAYVEDEVDENGYRREPVRTSEPLPDGYRTVDEPSYTSEPTPEPEPYASDDGGGEDEIIIEEEVEEVVEAAPVRRRKRAVRYDANADPSGALDKALEGLIASAQLARDRDPASPQAWRMRRVVGSLRFDRLPSPVHAPDASLREQLATSFAQGDYRAVIEEGEEALLDHPAWLDGHRLVAEALARSGAQWLGAHQVAVEETLALVTRAPGTVDRRFADDSPVADAATREWLESSRRRASGASVVVTAEDQEHERRVAQVHALAKEGRLPDAILLATALANRAADERGRFRGLLLAGTLALNASRPLVARPILESLLEIAERHQLETWEPTLCASLYGSLLSCLRVLRDPSSTEDARERDLFDRMCRLDPAAAMRLG